MLLWLVGCMDCGLIVMDIISLGLVRCLYDCWLDLLVFI